MSDTTKNGSARKGIEPPNKPYPDFPLSPHPRGQWQKKIRGKIHYFGRWNRRENGKLVRVPGDGWREALEAYKRVADDLHAGRTPRGDADGLTIRDLCNAYHNHKRSQLASGELSPYSFGEAERVTDRIVDHFGKARLVDDLRPEDFGAFRASMAAKWGPARLANQIGRVKSVFKFAFDNELIDKPVRYGSQFGKPTKATMRKHRAKSGAKTFDRDELASILDNAQGPFKAMVLLGINAGFGATDLSELTFERIDLKSGWIDFPRPKTGIPRRTPLWPETSEAIRAAIGQRPNPKTPEYGDRVFLTPRGLPLVRDDGKTRRDECAVRFSALIRKLGLQGNRRGFYALRHTFRTIADGTRDQVAVDSIMGHSDGSMAENYRHGIDDDRLRAVADHVRAWLYGASK